ncbi:MAG: AbrB/MazE/SpoVT family DNA-binding domain-containing protein [Xanthomonadales bacterium]|jgi:antitoxin VapB|nr:AbrB/MazE/SpoVT family DNA-binding domain-containing protein [Xanthomonadales bacterium]MBK7144127.1 AbrB/MazE/SpoVT family DNA-binding domain-containing protein [Xanthomonadales bacterium]MCC6560591.1 AbrB/MazE/SpoVT family DNA-binding domain-containing protein [Xanthomonadales bacterium]
MSQTAKLFSNGRSQAVRLPKEFRFEGSEVYVRRDPQTGDVILSQRPSDWSKFFEVLKGANFPADFLSPEERYLPEVPRDPLADL